ncbi:MAG: hypothetical protein BroJett040_18060 [Oligoflexia bacterium]|nr:MAG: hypothetical protein BroJett040_18060 [Oligoflexia bacterium]
MGAKNIRTAQESTTYARFDQLDGHHPWMDIIPDGHIPYKVRELRTGEIAYFNFVLAKEMGLIPSTHPQQMTSELKEKIIQTFSLQIINEYDELNNRRIDPSTIKPKSYMASRYLQLQHSNKQGKTSGDGRGIWNGTVEYRGKVWDVSSRGTGVTRLSPGAVEANRPLKTGGTEFGYGCGQAEIDELYGAAILAEIMHLQGIHTERVLCIIDLGKGYGIGVRAAPNLLRPAHLFLYLKQNRLKDLKNGFEYLMQRQIKNGKWHPKSRGTNRYMEFCEYIGKSFANFTAQLDIDYIFAWLDWDGDNVLADAGIIDYGSVRQFGIRHDRYRYDDVERFSTNLNEQRQKARLIVQVFVQIADYLKTGKKNPMKDYSKHPIVQQFNVQFAQARAHRLLYRMGFSETQRKNILKEKDLFNQFDKEFSYFERAKVSGNEQKVPDGVNHPALFNVRSLLKELPEFLFKNGFNSALMPEDIFFKKILSSFAKSHDARMGSKHKGNIQNFQRLYKMLVIAASGKQKPEQILPGIIQRAQKLNSENRITGNALIQIVNEIIAQLKKGMPIKEVQQIIDQLIFAQSGMPEVHVSKYFDQKPRLMTRADLYGKILNLVSEHKEDI